MCRSQPSAMGTGGERDSSWGPALEGGGGRRGGAPAFHGVRLCPQGPLRVSLRVPFGLAVRRQERSDYPRARLIRNGQSPSRDMWLFLYSVCDPVTKTLGIPRQRHVRERTHGHRGARVAPLACIYTLEGGRLVVARVAHPDPETGTRARGSATAVRTGSCPHGAAIG